MKRKKKIAEKIEEKERRDKEEAARKLAAKEAMKKLTAEEKLAEKLRQQRLQEEADLQVGVPFMGFYFLVVLFVKKLAKVLELKGNM